MRWSVLLLLTLTVGCSVFRSGDYRSSHPELFIKSIVIDDGGSIDETESMAILYLQPGQLFDGYELDADTKRLVDYYRLRGFPDARVYVDEAERRQDGVYIRYRVEPGPEMSISRMSVQSSGILSARKLKRLLRIDTGDRFDDHALELGCTRIRGALAARGYVHAEVTTKVSQKRGQASVVVVVSEGVRAHVGSIETAGLEKVKECVVHRELSMRTGDLFIPDRIYDTQNYLLATGLFSSVRVIVPGLERGDETLHVFIQIRESKHRFVEGGIGYSTPELSPDRVSATAAFGHENLWGRAASLRLEFELQREWSSDFWQQTANIDYLEPWMVGLPLSGGISFEYKHRSVENSAYQVAGASLLTGRTWHNRTSLYARYNFRSRTTDAGEDPSPLLQEEIDRPITNSIEGSLTLDSRDSFSDPHQGRLVRLQATHAGTFMGGDWSFRKLFLDGSLYQRLGEIGVLAIRARLGLIKPLGDSPTAPEEERFRAGGAFSVRGFKEEGLGPTDADGNAIGGEKLFIANAEFRIPIWGYLQGGIFFDIGQVWARPEEGIISDLEPAAGFGVRYATIIGPVRVDWGIPIRNRRQGRIYFTLGHAF